MMVGALNLISVAFAVLFVGLGVDFGIQFSVRYRAERHDARTICSTRSSDAGAQCRRAADARRGSRRRPASCRSCRPTTSGVSELGQIAGVGMIIAYLTSITLLPALLKVLNPPGEPEPLGYRFAGAGRPLPGAPPHPDHRRHGDGRRSAGCRCCSICSFDFNPINLRSPQGRIDRDLSRSAPRSDDRRQRASTCWRRRSTTPQPIAATSSQAAGSVAHVMTLEQLRSGRSGQEAGRSSRSCQERTRPTS